ncbi:MAG: type II secretion system F family protein [Candidatus Omnitrophica bacterium]|nr:type II secretion system F family protein [Candidatus Omnitrophota bacterium]
MPSYTYLARDERGKAVSGTMTAPTAEALADELRRMGYLVTRAREVRRRTRLEWLAERLSRVSYDELVLLTLQLSKMVQVGIPLLTAIKTLEAQTENRRLRRALETVGNDLESGNSFSQALARHPRIFSQLFVGMVRAGESSGRLDEILRRLADFHQRQAELRQQLQTAMTYPFLLMVVGVGVVTFLMIGIIPKFMHIFLEAGVPLPLPTLMIYHMSQLVRRGWLGIILAFVASVAGVGAILRTPQGRRYADRRLLALPVIGPLVRRVALARLAGTLGALVSSGVPILESLELVERTVGNTVIEEVVRAVHKSVQRGGGLTGPFQASGQIPPMAVQMIAVGESSGTLDHMLAQLAEHYDQMVHHAIKRLTAFVEPAFLLVMGAVVAFIMASVLLPMFRMVNVINK